MDRKPAARSGEEEGNEGQNPSLRSQQSVTAPTPRGEERAARLAAQFAEHDADMDLLRWTYELLGVTSTADDPLTFAQRALREARAALLAARRENETVQDLLNVIRNTQTDVKVWPHSEAETYEIEAESWELVCKLAARAARLAEGKKEGRLPAKGVW